jgi:hypothetical protein
MKQNMYKITATNRFQAVIQFLRKELGWQNGEPLVSNLLLIIRMLLILRWTPMLDAVYQLDVLACP